MFRNLVELPCQIIYVPNDLRDSKISKLFEFPSLRSSFVILLLGYRIKSLDFSDRLQVEINVHCYTKLVESVSILQQLPERIVTQIVANLKAEIYLPNDIIIKAGTYGDCMYFISSGTVVVSTANGHEVCHLQDGAYFGEVALIRKDNKRIANVVAIEFSEVYKLESKIFKTCLADQPETYKKLEKISQDRYNRTNFLEELHKKHILERTMARKRDLD